MVNTKSSVFAHPKMHFTTPSNSTWDNIIDTTLNVSSYEQVTKTLLRLLKIHVEKLIAVDQLSQALNETSIMQQLNPTSPCSYLLASDILSNMQGKQTAALDIINQGIFTASKTDPNYHKLLVTKDRVLKKQLLRIDLIRKLPVAIVRNSIAPLLLTSSMKHEVLKVSSTWQQRFAPVFGMHVDIRNARDWHKHRCIIDGARWIKTMSLKHCQQSPFKLLQRVDFRSLEKLYIEDCSVYGLSSGDIRHRGLTCLHVNKGYGASSVRLKAMMDAFPNLKNIQCYGECNLDASTLDLAQHYPQVHTLHFQTKSMSKKGVKCLLNCFPSLEHFAIFHSSPVQCLVEMAPMDSDGRLVYFGSSFDTCNKKKEEPAFRHSLYLDGEGLDLTTAGDYLLQASHPPMASVIFNRIRYSDINMARCLTMATTHAPGINAFVFDDLHLHKGQWMQFLQSWKPNGMQPFCLQFINCPGVTDRVLEDIIPRRSIQCLYLDGLENITQRGVSYLLRRKSFDEITVINCPNAIVPQSHHSHRY